MKRKSIYLLLLICSLSLISSARQRCTSGCTDKTAATQANRSEAEAESTRAGYDLSPVGFFVLNM
jgi:hypothetical protein